MATNISSFVKYILPDVPGCPSFAIEERVMDAIQQFCIDTKILTKATEYEDTDYTTIDSASNDSVDVDLTTHVSNLVPVTIVGLQIDGGDYDITEFTMTNDNSNLSSALVSSVKYFTWLSQTSIELFPFTDQTENFDLFFKVVYKPISTASTVEDIFFNDHKEAVCSLAKSYLQRIPDKAWTNLDQASTNAGIYRSRMGDAKIRVQNGYVVGSRRVNLSFFC